MSELHRNALCVCGCCRFWPHTAGQLEQSELTKAAPKTCFHSTCMVVLQLRRVADIIIIIVVVMYD